LVSLLSVLVVCLACAASAAAAPPANDSFASPTPITIGNPVSATTVEATKQTGEPNHAGNAGGHSVSFSWTATQTGMVGLSTPCSFSGELEPLVGVYTGSAVNALTPVASNDDGGGECSPASRLTFTATAGTVYRIAVDGKGGAVGPITLHLDSPPFNDDFAAAEEIPVDGGWMPEASALATSQGGEPLPGGHSLWYSWTPDAAAGAKRAVEGSPRRRRPVKGPDRPSETAQEAEVPRLSQGLQEGHQAEPARRRGAGPRARLGQ
jgi:hypothetical protein